MNTKYSAAWERALYVALTIALVSAGMYIVKTNSHSTAKVNLSEELADDQAGR